MESARVPRNFGICLKPGDQWSKSTQIPNTEEFYENLQKNTWSKNIEKMKSFHDLNIFWNMKNMKNIKENKNWTVGRDVNLETINLFLDISAAFRKLQILFSNYHPPLKDSVIFPTIKIDSKILSYP